MNNGNQALKIFIRETLGCRCPEKVFEKIEVEHFHPFEGVSEITRIVVGDTLLIYVAKPNVVKNVVEKLELIGEAGKADRDKNKYNRFRLVLPIAQDDPIANKITSRFLNEFQSDVKMHLHFVSGELIGDLNL